MMNIITHNQVPDNIISSLDVVCSADRDVGTSSTRVVLVLSLLMLQVILHFSLPVIFIFFLFIGVQKTV